MVKQPTNFRKANEYGLVTDKPVDVQYGPWARTMIAFDVDGIFKQDSKESEYVKGPLDPTKVKVMYDDGHFNTCVIVSPSPYFPCDNAGKSLFKRYCKESSNTYRHKNLLDAVDDCMVKPDIKIYVSDNGDVAEARKAGFLYCDVKDFVAMMEGKPNYPSNMNDLVEKTFDDIKNEEEYYAK